jgi:hypothetical protein
MSRRVYRCARTGADFTKAFADRILPQSVQEGDLFVSAGTFACCRAASFCSFGSLTVCLREMHHSKTMQAAELTTAPCRLVARQAFGNCCKRRRLAPLAAQPDTKDERQAQSPGAMLHFHSKCSLRLTLIKFHPTCRPEFCTVCCSRAVPVSREHLCTL